MPRGGVAKRLFCSAWNTTINTTIDTMILTIMNNASLGTSIHPPIYPSIHPPILPSIHRRRRSPMLCCYAVIGAQAVVDITCCWIARTSNHHVTISASSEGPCPYTDTMLLPDLESTMSSGFWREICSIYNDAWNHILNFAIHPFVSRAQQGHHWFQSCRYHSGVRMRKEDLSGDDHVITWSLLYRILRRSRCLTCCRRLRLWLQHRISVSETSNCVVLCVMLCCVVLWGVLKHNVIRLLTFSRKWCLEFLRMCSLYRSEPRTSSAEKAVLCYEP